MSHSPARPPGLTASPFRASQAIRAGIITRAQLRGAAWRQVFRDVYAAATLPDTHALRVAAAALLLPDGAMIAGRSAALVWGVAGMSEPATVEVWSPTSFGPVRGLHIHVGPIDPADRTTFRGLPVTTVCRTAWDIARHAPELEAVPWIDALARVRAVDPDTLAAYAAPRTGRWSRRARETLAMVDPRAESAPESILRVRLRRAGIAVVSQVWVTAGEEVVARVDLALPELRLAIEYDGQWHSDPDQLGRDRRRLRAINAAGWYVHPVTKEDLRNPDELVRELRRVIARLRRSWG